MSTPSFGQGGPASGSGNKRRSRPFGFTLIELMVVVAILAIVAAVAAPSFQATIANNRVASATEALREGVMLGRTEAIRRGSLIRMEPNCTPANWSCGWRLVDTISSQQVRVGEMPSGIVVSHVGNASDIVFNPNGTFTRPANSRFLIQAQGNTTGGRVLDLAGGLRICRVDSGDSCPN